MELFLISNDGYQFPVSPQILHQSNQWIRALLPGFPEYTTKRVSVNLNRNQLDYVLDLLDMDMIQLKQEIGLLSLGERTILWEIADMNIIPILMETLNNLYPNGHLNSKITMITIIGRDEWENFSRYNPSSNQIRLFISGDRLVSNLKEFMPYAERIISINFFSTPLLSLAGLTRFTQLTSLNVSRTQITNVELDHLSTLTRLTRLELNGNDISRIDPIQPLVNLTKLGLACTFVTDLSPLSNMNKLVTLDLYMTEVTSLSHILDLPIQDLDRRQTNLNLTDVQLMFPKAKIV